MGKRDHIGGERLDVRRLDQTNDLPAIRRIVQHTVARYRKSLNDLTNYLAENVLPIGELDQCHPGWHVADHTTARLDRLHRLTSVEQPGAAHLVSIQQAALRQTFGFPRCLVAYL